ncbi:hypothetical protein GH742_04760 [Legionella sp. MW5194]|uniref:hypothetical protein n=1 Tax=Legionella sp. MW5194 TaxID=2662448 RepID=UPI00193E6092|nr:hypothetical protein [Legionella sp. MW5194]QRN03233.1 hypothetical protein GH742_04760 [Legionella sp. MW5194]
MKKVSFIVFLALIASGCSHVKNNSDQKYLQSRNGPGLVVPSPLTSDNVSHFYDLPAQDNKAKVSIEPPSAKIE